MDQWLPKGKGLGRRGGKGGKRGITISTHNVGGGHREGCTTQRRQVVIPQHLTMPMDSACNGVCVEGLGEWGSLVNIMFFM